MSSAIPRYLTQRATNIDADPRALFVCREKHNTYYYRPADFGGYFAMCLAIFQRRDADGVYPREVTPYPTEPPAPPQNADAGIVHFHAQRVAQYHETVRRVREAHDLWLLLVDARAKNSAAAAMILDLRANYEYEGVRRDALTVP